MSNDKIKWEALQYVRTWLLQERETDGEIIKRNLDLIVDTFLLQQLISFTLTGNYDAVMGLIGCVIGLEEIHNTSRNQFQNEQYNEVDRQFLKSVVNNKRLFYK